LAPLAQVETLLQVKPELLGVLAEWQSIAQQKLPLSLYRFPLQQQYPHACIRAS
jgi:hypothetical protein